MFSKKLRDTCSVRPVSCSDAVKYAHWRGATHRADSAYFGHVASPNLWLGTEAVTSAQVTHHEQKLWLTFWRFLRNALDASMLPGRDAISRPGSCRTRLRTVQVRRSRDAGAHAFVLGPALRTLQQSSVRFSGCDFGYRSEGYRTLEAAPKPSCPGRCSARPSATPTRRSCQRCRCGAISGEGVLVFSIAILQCCFFYCNIAILQYCNIAIRSGLLAFVNGAAECCHI